MRELKKVKLKKTDTCLTYALRRIGAEDLIDKISYENIHEYFAFTNFGRRSKEKLQKGQILLWDRDVEYIDLPWSIDENGMIIWSKIPVAFHFAVYEGEDIFSDCTRLARSPHPSLRMRRFSELKKMPDQVLTLIDLK